MQFGIFFEILNHLERVTNVLHLNFETTDIVNLLKSFTTAYPDFTYVWTEFKWLSSFSKSLKNMLEIMISKYQTEDLNDYCIALCQIIHVLGKLLMLKIQGEDSTY